MEPPDAQPVTVYPTVYATFRAYAAAMREIVEAMADAGPMIPPFDQYDGAIMERFITKARALLAKDEERDK